MDGWIDRYIDRSMTASNGCMDKSMDGWVDG